MSELFLRALFPFQTGSKESSCLSLKLFTRSSCVCVFSGSLATGRGKGGCWGETHSRALEGEGSAN